MQRGDAGEYYCTLSVNNVIKRSQSVFLEVEGRFNKVITADASLLTAFDQYYGMHF